MSLGAGRFRLSGGGTQLVDVRSSHDDIDARAERAGTRGRVRLRQDARWFPFGYRGDVNWELQVAGTVATALSMTAGAGEFTVNLEQMRIVEARFNVGAARARVVLPRPSGEVRMSITTGAASLEIQVPAGVEAGISTSGGLMKFEGRNETPGYVTARDRVTLAISGGASSVRVI